jgi:ribonuclease HI
VLTHDDGISQLELQTDASGKGLGAVLYLIKDDVKKPISFASRRLEGAEERYHVNELEFLALLWALKRFQHHVYGRNVLVKTDSSVVKWVIERADATKNDRLRRWLMELRGYDISVQHLKGASNTVADALSRSPVDCAIDPKEDYIGALIPSRYAPRDLAILQYGDEEIKKLVLTLQEIGERPFEDTSEFVLREGIVYKRNHLSGRQHLLFVPSCIRQDLIREYHDMPVSGHHGREKTLARLSQRFYWRGMEKNVRHYVRSCSFYQLFKVKGGRKAGKLCPIKPPRHVYEQIGIDHLVPFKMTERGNQHLIVCIDYLSRYLEVRAVPSTNTAAVVRFLKERIFTRHGVPSYIFSDAGTAYSSHEFHDFVEEWRVVHFMASVEHAATNGLVEKANGSLTATFAAYVNLDHDDLDEKIPDAVFAGCHEYGQTGNREDLSFRVGIWTHGRDVN